VVQAPGRLNLIGEHTDYNGGFVLPAAVGLRTLVGIATRPDHQLLIPSENFSERVEFEVENLPASPRYHWSDYVVGVAKEFHEQVGALRGMNLLIQRNVPQGSGLSSSASIEVAVFCALCELRGAKFDGVRTAKLCQRAENEFVGARRGIMDPFVALCGRKSHAVLLDCDRLLPIAAGCAWSCAIRWCGTRCREESTIGGGRSAKLVHGFFAE
jgi:galactokinase